MAGPWTPVSPPSTIVRGLIGVELHHLRCGDGAVRQIPQVTAPAFVIVVAHCTDASVLMVRQHRYAIDRWTYELPAGAVDPGETPLMAAERELLEETAHRAGRMRFLGEYAHAPALMSTTAHYFLATDCVPVEGAPDDECECERVPVDEVWDRLHVGSVAVGTSTLAWMVAERERASTKGNA